jgi:hypothetical protein
MGLHHPILIEPIGRQGVSGGRDRRRWAERVGPHPGGPRRSSASPSRRRRSAIPAGRGRAWGGGQPYLSSSWSSEWSTPTSAPWAADVRNGSRGRLDRLLPSIEFGNVCCSRSSWASAPRTIRCRSSVSPGGITPIGEVGEPRAGLAQRVRTGGANGVLRALDAEAQTRGGACAVSHAECERDGGDTGVVCIQASAPSPRVADDECIPSESAGWHQPDRDARRGARSTWRPLRRNLALVACARYGCAAIA